MCVPSKPVGYIQVVLRKSSKGVKHIRRTIDIIDGSVAMSSDITQG